MLQETRDNTDLLSMIGEGGAKNADSDEYKSMRERVHLLTEENHILFE